MYRQLGQYEKTINLLENIDESDRTERIWMQAAQVRREIGQETKSLEIVEKALSKEYEENRDFFKLWLIKA
jgi:tetratricopeptide (TPR) repeat protein